MDDQTQRKRPSAEPDTLKIDLSFEEAVRRAMRATIPPRGIPDRETQKRAPGAGRPRKK
jgi:hypothetical protein